MMRKIVDTSAFDQINVQNISQLTVRICRAVFPGTNTFNCPSKMTSGRRKYLNDTQNVPGRNKTQIDLII